MRVIVYGPGAGAPPGHEFVAHLYYVEHDPKRGAVTKAHPVMIFGVSEERARERAETWLAAELERAKPKAPRTRKAAPVADEPIEEVI